MGGGEIWCKCIQKDKSFFFKFFSCQLNVSRAIVVRYNKSFVLPLLASLNLRRSLFISIFVTGSNKLQGLCAKRGTSALMKYVQPRFRLFFSNPLLPPRGHHLARQPFGCAQFVLLYYKKNKLLNKPVIFNPVLHLSPSSLHEYTVCCLTHCFLSPSTPLCSVHHGCWTAGLPLWPQFLTGQVLLWGLRHLLCWRVSDRLGLHAGHRRSHAHRLLALFCQICTEGAAFPHPFTHTVIVHRCGLSPHHHLLTTLSNPGLMSDGGHVMLFGKAHSVKTELTLSVFLQLLCN